MSEGEGETILLLHGLMGSLSNFAEFIAEFGKTHKVVLPILPIFELPIKKAGISGLLDYVKRFITYKELTNIHLLGNSLGGHIAQLLTFDYPELIKSMTLTASSGLFENSFGNSFPRRGDYEYIKNKVGLTFYDPNIASKEMVDEVFDMVNDKNKAIRIVITAKSAIRHNVADKLPEIKCPCLLIWGKDDTITPPFVAEQFDEILNDSTLCMIDKCGHAPMMERPEEFNKKFAEFLQTKFA